MDKMKLHLAVLRRLRDEGLLINIAFDKLPLGIKNRIFENAMNKPENDIEDYYRSLAKQEKIGFMGVK